MCGCVYEFVYLVCEVYACVVVVVDFVCVCVCVCMCMSLCI